MRVRKIARKGKVKRKKMKAIRRAARKRNAPANRGYDEGYSDALKHAQALNKAEYQNGYESGYNQGLYAGGEGLVEAALPPLMTLPNCKAEDVVTAGVEKLIPAHGRPLADPAAVFERLMAAMDGHAPLSVVRLGDGEALALAQDAAMSVEQVQREGHFLPYAGVDVPDLEARNALANAIRGAHLVGIPISRKPNFQPLLSAAFRAHGIDISGMQLTSSVINYQLYERGFLGRLLDRRKVLLVGDKAPAFAEWLHPYGVHVVGAIAPVNGVKDVPRVMKEIEPIHFDIALVSAGIAAVLIAQQIAGQLGKVAIDFGHLADRMMLGEAPYR